MSMADALRAFIHDMQGKQQARTANLAARAMAKHCDARIKRVKKALSLIDTFAWSMIHGDTPQCERELMRRITVIRKTLAEL
jgi:hypothetical protein